MIDIRICEKLKKVCPQMTLGCIQANVCVENASDDLWKEINNYCDNIKKEIQIEDLAKLSKINDGRQVYKKLGKVPSKYRLSSEALIRRVLQGKGVYKINNVVDVNNLISLKSLYSVGSYDTDKLKQPVILDIGKEGDEYKGIGKGVINVENIPVFCDQLGNFGSPTSDSTRAMIKEETMNIIMIIISFSGNENIENYMQYAKEKLEKYAKAIKVECRVVI